MQKKLPKLAVHQVLAVIPQYILPQKLHREHSVSDCTLARSLWRC